VKLLVRLLVIVAMGAVARDASAFSIGCDKLPFNVGRTPVFYASGANSNRAAAIHNGVAQWNRVIRGNNGVRVAGTFTGSHNLDTLPNQVSWANEGSLFLGSAVGRTFLRSENCIIRGFDILLSNNATYAPPPDSGPVSHPSLGFPDVGWHVALHEFGHAYGMALNNTHPNTFAIMRGGGPLPTFGAFPGGASAAALAPDDAAGARALYTFDGFPVNVTSTQTQLIFGQIGRVWNPPLTNGTFTVCRGQIFPIVSNTANTGIAELTINHRIYLQAVETGNPWDAFAPQNVTISEQFGAVHSPNSTNRIEHTARVPCGTRPDVYHAMHFSDSTNRITVEYDELDNTSMFQVPVIVHSCNTVACIGFP
jgi:hypothetical protein